MNDDAPHNCTYANHFLVVEFVFVMPAVGGSCATDRVDLSLRSEYFILRSAHWWHSGLSMLGHCIQGSIDT